MNSISYTLLNEIYEISNNIPRVLRSVNTVVLCYPKIMNIRKKFAPYLFIAILSFIGLFLYIHTFSPTKQIDFFGVQIIPVAPFLAIFFLSISCLFAFILANSRRGLLIGLFALSFLFLQYIRYNNVFYTILLILIFTLIEFLFWKKK
jgi:hypothetical protein